MEKRPGMAPTGAMMMCFPNNSDLADIFGRTDFAFENHYVLHFFDFSGPRKKMPGMAPNGAGRFFFRPIQTLPTFWVTWFVILRISMFGIWLDSEIPYPGSPESGFSNFLKSGFSGF